MLCKPTQSRTLKSKLLGRHAEMASWRTKGKKSIKEKHEHAAEAERAQYQLEPMEVEEQSRGTWLWAKLRLCYDFPPSCRQMFQSCIFWKKTIIVKLQRYQFSFRNIHLVQTYPIIAKANKAKDITDVTHLCHLLFWEESEKRYTCLRQIWVMPALAKSIYQVLPLPNHWRYKQKLSTDRKIKHNTCASEIWPMKWLSLHARQHSLWKINWRTDHHNSGAFVLRQRSILSYL